MRTADIKKHAGSLARTPSGLGAEGVAEISKALTAVLADLFALYVKTKNFHWHMSGPHFRDYHLLLDDQSAEIIAMTDPLAERVRTLGACTIRSIGDIFRQQRLKDNDADFVHPHRNARRTARGHCSTRPEHAL